ncbi:MULTISPECIES: type II toxin-antitoxin system TacA family antitoxin [unclassified Frankia]|uniref:type II toxin-antitoxin system TacA family antitoxin n=1 Tax=unclassified Frankia TaxID=2632575 RepID=UPI002023E5EE
MIKSSRIAVRLPEEQDALIRVAAEVEGSTVTEFTVNAAVARAKDVLAEQRLFTLGSEAWTEFLTILDRPVTRKPRLERLLTEEPIFE